MAPGGPIWTRGAIWGDWGDYGVPPGIHPLRPGEARIRPCEATGPGALFIGYLRLFGAIWAHMGSGGLDPGSETNEPSGGESGQ